MSDRKSKYLLHVENVYKEYGPRLILDNIDFSVSEGELCTVVGPSGCGKSTLLRLIVGQERPSSGSLYMDGSLIGYPNTKRGIVYQRYTLYPHLTVLENICLGKKLRYDWEKRRKFKQQIIEEAMEFLKRVRLDEHANKYPHELSGGMQQRAAIAQAMIMRPRILLMDEPFGALDPQTREEMQLFLLELWEKENMTVFFVTHDLEEAAYLGTRIFVLSQYYTDDRGNGKNVKRGAKIVTDYALTHSAISSEVKNKGEFKQLLETIRKSGFDPEFLQHVMDFNLKHPDSFQTLTEEEYQNQSS